MSRAEKTDTEGDAPRRTGWRLWLRRIGIAMLALFGLLLIVATVLLWLAWEAMGTAPEGERLERMQASPNWDAAEEVFVNALPQHQDWGLMWDAMLEGSDHTVPDDALPVVEVDPSMFASPPASGLRVTWLGHSTLLIEIDGARILTDPVWGERASPLTFLGPQRWYAPLIALEDLPTIDAVLISHDHYDHLDHPTMLAMRHWNTRFVVPLGVGAHLEYWGVPADKIVELDWWESTQLGGVEIVSTPARHASGRHVFDRDRTLWASYAVVGAEHRAWFSGDTGLFPEVDEIGQRLGPFDVTMVEVGAYNRAWPDWHLGPEQAIEAHQRVRGDAFMPVHWGLFNLARHGWTEPVERTLVAAEAAGVRALTPRPGESLEPTAATSTRWWPQLPWQTADEHAVRSTGL